MLSLRERFPDMNLKDFSPKYFVDPDGLVEVVLAVEELEPRAVETAVRLFCMRNQVRNCYLDGGQVFPSKEEP